LMNGEPALRGHVESISRGIMDRDNTSGPDLLANVTPTFEWVRLAQRIPVRIHIDHVPEGVLISSGMTCTVQVEAPPRPWAAAGLVNELASYVSSYVSRWFFPWRRSQALQRETETVGTQARSPPPPDVF
jgi:hypothetical protein